MRIRMLGAAEFRPSFVVCRHPHFSDARLQLSTVSEDSLTKQNSSAAKFWMIVRPSAHPLVYVYTYVYMMTAHSSAIFGVRNISQISVTCQDS